MPAGADADDLRGNRQWHGLLRERTHLAGDPLFEQSVTFTVTFAPASTGSAKWDARRSVHGKRLDAE